jgi:hypothetical protein
MVRLVEVVLEPGKRARPPLETPAGASRLRCAAHPGYAAVGVPGDLHHSRGRQLVLCLAKVWCPLGGAQDHLAA